MRKMRLSQDSWSYPGASYYEKHCYFVLILPTNPIQNPSRRQPMACSRVEITSRKKPHNCSISQLLYCNHPYFLMHWILQISSKLTYDSNIGSLAFFSSTIRKLSWTLSKTHWSSDPDYSPFGICYSVTVVTWIFDLSMNYGDYFGILLIVRNIAGYLWCTIIDLTCRSGRYFGHQWKSLLG